MAVWDCFTFYNELDVLEARLVELDGVADRIVIAEATTTHTGHPKPLYFAESRSRFSRFASRIEHLAVELPPGDGVDPWERERAQRDALAGALEQADPADLVIVSDVDEIPRAAAIPEVSRLTLYGPVMLAMRLYVYSLHWRDPATWLHAKAMRARDALRLRSERGWSLSDLRLCFDFPVVSEAGWHFSSFFGPEDLALKLRSFAHSKVDTPEIDATTALAQALQAGVSPSGSVLDRVNDQFPEHISRLLGRGGRGGAHSAGAQQNR